jgi:hypothetical protein
MPQQLMVAVDAGVAVFCGLLVLKVLLDARARQIAVWQRLQMIAELNHHVRNALESIQLSAYSIKDQPSIRIIQESVDRIQWALREVLPSEDEIVD